MSIKKISIILCTSSVALDACSSKVNPSQTRTKETDQVSSIAKYQSKKVKYADNKAKRNKSEESQSSEFSSEPFTTETPIISPKNNDRTLI